MIIYSRKMAPLSFNQAIEQYDSTALGEYKKYYKIVEQIMKQILVLEGAKSSVLLRYADKPDKLASKIEKTLLQQCQELEGIIAEENPFQYDDDKLNFATLFLLQYSVSGDYTDSFVEHEGGKRESYQSPVKHKVTVFAELQQAGKSYTYELMQYQGLQNGGIWRFIPREVYTSAVHVAKIQSILLSLTTALSLYYRNNLSFKEVSPIRLMPSSIDRLGATEELEKLWSFEDGNDEALFVDEYRFNPYDIPMLDRFGLTYDNDYVLRQWVIGDFLGVYPGIKGETKFDWAITLYRNIHSSDETVEIRAIFTDPNNKSLEDFYFYEFEPKSMKIQFFPLPIDPVNSKHLVRPRSGILTTSIMNLAICMCEIMNGLVGEQFSLHVDYEKGFVYITNVPPGRTVSDPQNYQGPFVVKAKSYSPIPVETTAKKDDAKSKGKGKGKASFEPESDDEDMTTAMLPRKRRRIGCQLCNKTPARFEANFKNKKHVFCSKECTLKYKEMQ